MRGAITKLNVVREFNRKKLQFSQDNNSQHIFQARPSTFLPCNDKTLPQESQSRKQLRRNICQSMGSRLIHPSKEEEKGEHLVQKNTSQIMRRGRLTRLRPHPHRNSPIRRIILLLQLHIPKILQRTIPALTKRNHALVFSNFTIPFACQRVQRMFLAEVEESTFWLLQHGVVSRFDGCQEARDVAGFDCHADVEDEG
jgi:hypothetical protein